MRTLARVSFVVYLLLVAAAAFVVRSDPPGAGYSGFFGAMASLIVGLPWSAAVLYGHVADRDLLTFCWSGVAVNLWLLGAAAHWWPPLGPFPWLWSLATRATVRVARGDVPAALRITPGFHLHLRDLAWSVPLAAAWLLLARLAAPAAQAELSVLRFLAALAASPFVLAGLVLPPLLAIPAGVALTFGASFYLVARVRGRRRRTANA